MPSRKSRAKRSIPEISWFPECSTVNFSGVHSRTRASRRSIPHKPKPCRESRRFLRRRIWRIPILYYSGRPVVAIDKVRYAGEPVAAVAAEDLRRAEEALSLIHVDYEELPAFVGLDAALRGENPLIHEDSPGNICGHERVERGNIEQGFAEADEIFEDIFTFPMVYHYAMEPHTVVAEWNEEGIKVLSSAQHPFQVRGDLARIFLLPPSKVEVIIPYLGGGSREQVVHKIRALGCRARAQGEAPRADCEHRLGIHAHRAPAQRSGQAENRG